MNRKENQWVINYINIPMEYPHNVILCSSKKKKKKEKKKMKNVSECFHGSISGTIFLNINLEKEKW